MPAPPRLSCRPLRDLAPAILGRDATAREATLLRAEDLHDSLEPDATYPVDYLAFRLTGLRRDLGDTTLLLGSAVSADLRRLIDALSRGLDLPVDPPASRLAGDWAVRLEVSPRTLARWREDGLRWRWLTPAVTGRRQIGFTAAAIEHHRRVRPGRVEHATTFTQLPPEDAAAALGRAAALAAEGRSLSSAAATLAAELGRAHETLRQRLLRHDAERLARGEEPLFPRKERLTREQRAAIRGGNRRGLTIPRIASGLGLPQPVVRRAVLGHRAAVALRLPIHLPTRASGRSAPDEAAPPRHAAPLPPGLPPDLAAALAMPPPPPADTRALAAAYRERRAEAVGLRAGFRPTAPPSARALDAFAAAVREAAAARRRLVAAALPELLSVARRHLPSGTPAGPLVALLEAGLPDLLHEVDRFDPGGPLPLHRVLRNRLLRTFAREDPASRAHRRDAADRLWWRLRPLLESRITRDPDVGAPPTGGAADA